MSNPLIRTASLQNKMKSVTTFFVNVSFLLIDSAFVGFKKIGSDKAF